VYVGQIPQDVDQLKQNKNVMIGLGYALQAILGTGTLVDGLACNPTAPASLAVTVGPGSIYSLQNVDGTAYGSLAADTTDPIVKQGIIMSTQTFNCPAPSTSGFSIVYLVEATYEDVDGGSTVLPYYNASNPSQAYNGPNNTGTSQNTVRQGVCNIQVKTGIAATTGTQVTPTPDAGYTGLYAITVANGQTTITSANIAPLSTAPFISPKLPSVVSTVQSGASNYAVDTSGTANTITIALTPPVSTLTAGIEVRVKVANTNTGAVVINTNGLGNVSATLQTGGAIPAGALQAGGIYNFKYDGTKWQTGSSATARQLLTSNTTFYVATTGSDSNSGLTSGAPWLTLQHAWNAIGNGYDLAGYTATIQLADGTYTAGLNATVAPVGGSITINGDAVTPSNVVISTTSANALTFNASGTTTIQNMELTTATSGICLYAVNGSTVNVGAGLIFGACAGEHVLASGNANINLNNNYSVTGSATRHWHAVNSGIITADGITLTLTGTPSFSTAFAQAERIGYIESTGDSFSGSATGSRYSANSNGVINSGGGGATYLPGSTSGTTATGGQYI